MQMNMNKISEIIDLNKKEMKRLISIITVSTILPSISTYTYKLVGDIIDIDIRENQKAFWTIVIILMAVNVLYYFLTRLKIQIHGNFMIHIISDVRKKFSKKIIESDFKYFESSTHGKFVSLYNNNISRLKFLIEDILSFISNALILVIMFGYIAFNNLEFLFFCTISLCLGIYLANVLGKTLSSLSKDIYENQYMVSQSIVDGIKGHEAIRIYNLQELFIGKFKKQCDTILEKNLKLEKRLIFIGGTTVLLNIVPVMLCIGYGSYLVQRQVITIGVMISFIPVVTKLSQTISHIFSLGGKIKAQLVIIDGLKEILESPSERAPIGPIKLFKSDIAIHFDSVSFGYDTNNVLNNISFSIREGKKVGLAGPSGCGKTTITKLISGLYSAQMGVVSIYNQEVSSLDLKSVRDKLSVIPQKTHMYPLSLDENIRLENQSIKKSEIVNALQSINLDRFIKELDLDVDENKYINLSGGEIQRIGILRGLLNDSNIYIFDEPTAQLDLDTKEKVIQKILSLENKTCVIVSHDISVLKELDEVILIDDGKIVGKGSHNELIKSNSLYNNFCIKGEFNREMGDD